MRARAEQISSIIMALDLSFGLGYSPVLWSVYTVCTISLCYYIGVSNGHLYPYVPSVSHTGASSPERNIFSMLLEFGAFWSFGNLVIRYLQVNILIAKVVSDVESMLLILKNKVSFCFGFLSVIGLVIIANWPSPNVSTVKFLCMFLFSISSLLLLSQEKNVIFRVFFRIFSSSQDLY